MIVYTVPTPRLVLTQPNIYINVNCAGCYDYNCETCIQRDKFALSRHKAFALLNDEKKDKQMKEEEMKSMKQEIADLKQMVRDLTTKPSVDQDP